ncbi:hypothetical protein SGR_6719 [Streptomyces griseus subsp. griseus NBRC 13350]|uniref:Secreted protein n=1 Tax=Streptomyces griseus subsp. griseus (strain JCM 4626 / CBS 651.72 / NBRC 13350 / KCC S-0626 / ISP 5235) TaxID=455632 RepID=B1VMS3_STRGG|nr:hypothetical protein SGR_6719 [Streptomyces griseus subsp. griseus NBRC 13350]
MRSWPISATFFISSAFTHAARCAMVWSGPWPQGDGAAASRTASSRPSSTTSQDSRSSRSQPIAPAASPGHATSSRSRGARPEECSIVVLHHQPMCQLSQPIVGTGTGSGSVSAQSGIHRPSARRRTVQHRGAGCQRKSSVSSRSRWYSNSDQVRSNWWRRRSHREAFTGRP